MRRVRIGNCGRLKRLVLGGEEFPTETRSKWPGHVRFRYRA